jgi:hypothetical protein
MAHRTGRRHASETYPENSRAAGATVFARNYARGPASNTAIATAGGGGTQIPWDFIESGAPLGVNVPITPRATGRILFSGAVVVQNTTGGVITVTLQVEVDNATLPAPLVKATIAANAFETIPFEMISEALLPVGTTANIEVIMTASAGASVNIVQDSSTLEIEELQLATG